jgi:hypothetical protein
MAQVPSEPLAPPLHHAAVGSTAEAEADDRTGGALVIGPVLRRVSAQRATIWVQIKRAGTVRVRAGDATAESRTFCAHGLHFAVVVVDGLAAGATTAYEVDVDGEPVWPPAAYAYPAPVITTQGGDDRPIHIVFGSCRESSPAHAAGLDPDALNAYAVRLAADPSGTRPDLLMLLGDQVYADVTSKSTRAWLRRHRRERRRADAPPKQVVTFGEYARLYRESWSDPDVRWLLSTVPTVMIFDDHEIIDDWNISLSWRRDIGKLDWWPERIAAGLASYWVFQHAGNIDPAELSADPIYQRIASLRGADAADALRDFAAAADAAGGVAATGSAAESVTAVADPAGSYRWSYQFDIGGTKIVMLDNRNSRVLTPGRRAMLSPADWSWFTNAVTGAHAEYHHLVIGSSLPWLMPFGIHDLGAASERWAESRSRPLAALGERLRRAFDLEHWPAFGSSFDDLAALLAEIGRRDAGHSGPPISISVLSGDVHHSYVARALYGSDVVTPVHQLTCSPVHNRVPSVIKPLMRLAWRRRGKRIGRVLARRAGATRPLIS